MNEKDLFPDYKPKTTPDTIRDYLRYPKTNIFTHLGEIGKPTLDKFNNILKLFKQFQKKAQKNPGHLKNGRVGLGENIKQYVPSEEELLVSELGNMIKEILEFNSKDKIETYKNKEGIKTQNIEYYNIYFRHVDVMGSGRYFYAEKVEDKFILQL